LIEKWASEGVLRTQNDGAFTQVFARIAAQTTGDGVSGQLRVGVVGGGAQHDPVAQIFVHRQGVVAVGVVRHVFDGLFARMRHHTEAIAQIKGRAQIQIGAAL